MLNQANVDISRILWLNHQLTRMLPIFPAASVLCLQMTALLDNVPTYSTIRHS